MKKLLLNLRCIAPLALAALALGAVPAMNAHEKPEMRPLADKPAATLPLKAVFEKAEPGKRGAPFAVTLTNTSDKTLHVAAKVAYAVAIHDEPNTAQLPTHEIKAGASWTINDLSVDDRITLSSEGYEDLNLKVPAKPTS